MDLFCLPRRTRNRRADGQVSDDNTTNRLLRAARDAPRSQDAPRAFTIVDVLERIIAM